jgi:PucR-like helix-turn-helix protein
VPVSYRGARLGYLWLVDDGERLGSTQVRTAAHAADQAGLLMFGDMLGERMASGVLGQRLSLHRGTLYYRLRKAERIAGVDLRSGCDRLALHLGFKLARLIGLYPP